MDHYYKQFRIAAQGYYEPINDTLSKSIAIVLQVCIYAGLRNSVASFALEWSTQITKQWRWSYVAKFMDEGRADT